jgi:hypothetical protein
MLTVYFGDIVRDRGDKIAGLILHLQNIHFIVVYQSRPLTLCKVQNYVAYSETTKAGNRR